MSVIDMREKDRYQTYERERKKYIRHMRERERYIYIRHMRDRERDMNHLLEVLDNMPEQNNLDDADDTTDNVDDHSDNVEDYNDGDYDDDIPTDVDVVTTDYVDDYVSTDDIDDQVTTDVADDDNDVDVEAGGRERGVNNDGHLNGDIMKGTSFDLY